MTSLEITPPVKDESSGRFTKFADRTKAALQNPELRARVKEAAPRVGLRVVEGVGVLKKDKSSGQRSLNPEGITALRDLSGQELVTKVAKATAIEVGREAVHQLVTPIQSETGAPAGFEPTVAGTDQAPMPSDTDVAPEGMPTPEAPTASRHLRIVK